MNALLNIACVVNGRDAPTVNRGCKGSNLIDFEDACVVGPGRAVHAINHGPAGGLPLRQPNLMELDMSSTQVTFTSSTELAAALRRAEAAHAEHEKRTGQPDPNWPDWYAEYIVREQAGQQLPS